MLFWFLILFLILHQFTSIAISQESKSHVFFWQGHFLVNFFQLFLLKGKVPFPKPQIVVSSNNYNPPTMSIHLIIPLSNLCYFQIHLLLFTMISFIPIDLPSLCMVESVSILFVSIIFPFSWFFKPHIFHPLLLLAWKLCVIFFPIMVCIRYIINPQTTIQMNPSVSIRNTIHNAFPFLLALVP